jgi:hypothetical protein
LPNPSWSLQMLFPNFLSVLDLLLVLVCTCSLEQAFLDLHSLSGSSRKFSVKTKKSKLCCYRAERWSISAKLGRCASPLFFLIFFLLKSQMCVIQDKRRTGRNFVTNYILVSKYALGFSKLFLTCCGTFHKALKTSLILSSSEIGE